MDEPQSLNDAPTLPARPIHPLRSMSERARAALGRGAPLRILVVILLVLVAAAAIVPAILYARQPHPTFATARVGDVIQSVSVDGEVQATTYDADFPVSGDLSEIDVTLGQQVRKGDTLAKLTVAPFQSAVTAAQNGESAAQQSLSAAQTAQSQAQTAVLSASSALATQQSYAQLQCAAQPSDPDACAAANAAVARAQAQLATSQAQLASAQTQVATARKALSAAQAKTQRAQAQLASATLTAPHAGIVTTINGAVGGKPGASPYGVGSFITIADTSAPLATAMVSYRDVSLVRVGQTATFLVPQASASGVFTGVVTGVAPAPQGAGDTLRYPIALRIDPASLGGVTLLPGMTAATRIITRARYHVIVIPNSAVDYARQAAPENGEGVLTRSQIAAAQQRAHAMAQSVAASGFDVASDPLTATYLVGFQNNHYVAIPVVLGLTNGQQWEVVAGLATGQQVVDGQSGIFG